MTTLLLLFGLGCSTNPDAPPEVQFDHEACTHCGMLISEPRYAAALTTSDGKSVHFDDAGCLFRYVLAEHPSVRHMWFHGEGNVWLNESEVGFLTGATTPMGSGLAAVPAGSAGAIGVGEASGRALTGGPP